MLARGRFPLLFHAHLAAVDGLTEVHSVGIDANDLQYLKRLRYDSS
jgi:hypothetical protein